MAFLSEQRQRIGRLNHASKIDLRADMGAGASQADIAQRSARTRADLHDVFGGEVAIHQGGDRRESETDLQFIRRKTRRWWATSRAGGQGTEKRSRAAAAQMRRDPVAGRIWA